MNRLTSEIFFKRCKLKFKGRFKYHNDYTTINNKIKVGCPIHGDFEIKAEHHSQSKNGGCLKCQIEKHKKKYLFNGDIFIEKSKIKHNNKYDYSKVKYVNNETNVIITCSEHGDFIKKPTCHLNRGQGCVECSKKTMGGYGGYNLKNADKFKDTWSKKRGYIYIVKISDDTESFIKIGITTQKKPKRRFSGFKYSINFIKMIEGNLYDLIYKERELLDKFKDFKYVPKQKFNGCTECFNLNVCKNIMNI